MSSEYSQWWDGEWGTPVMRGFRMMCCSCSLVHKINFRVDRGNQVSMQVFVDNRATAAARAAQKRKEKRMPCGKKKKKKKKSTY